MNDPSMPILLGLSGKAGVGKTTMADHLCPPASTNNMHGGVRWSHLAFASPLHSMVAIKRSIEGTEARERKKYEILSALLDVFPNPLMGAPPLFELMDLVNYIVDYQIPYQTKPREFLLDIGDDKCKSFDPNCWVNWMKRKVYEEHSRYHMDVRMERALKGESLEEYDPSPFGIVISDVRFLNEAEYIKNHPNGFLVRLNANDEIINERQEARDGYAMSEEMRNHVSENEVNSLDEGYFDIVLDNSDLNVNESVDKIINAIMEQSYA